MRRPAVATVLALCLLVGCGASAHRTRRQAELGIGGSLAGVMLTSFAIAALPAQKPVLIPIAIVFGGLAVVSTIVFGVAYGNEEPAVPPVPPPRPPDHRAEAWALTQQAQAAARANDCATVKQLEGPVGDADPEFYVAVFKRDVAIARCLATP